ncbi:MAG UNVERIFIED_CONTAM: hypothetical protein LVR18_47025 [Planctomycetaceae bacterium]|jgi:hypothetical protein
MQADGPSLVSSAPAPPAPAIASRAEPPRAAAAATAVCAVFGIVAAVLHFRGISAPDPWFLRLPLRPASLAEESRCEMRSWHFVSVH